jgi:hypothetical protein
VIGVDLVLHLGVALLGGWIGFLVRDALAERAVHRARWAPCGCPVRPHVRHLSGCRADADGWTWATDATDLTRGE